MALKFTALSGTTTVTHNMYVYETDRQMLVVDCGVGFPDINAQGVDLILPDFSYVVKNKNKLVGILLSHGHEDHIGAVPYFLREVNAPVWGTRLVSAFLDEKFKDHKLNVKLNTFSENGDEFDIGEFHINSFRTTHSIPETTGFSIDTPEGRVFHVPEHKIDQHPVDGMAFDETRARGLAQNVLFLASDSLGANKKGVTREETHIEGNLLEIVKSAGNAVLFTAISSNIGRFKQIMNVAKTVDRKIVFVGYSIWKKCEIARELGYLDYQNDFVVGTQEAKKMEGRKLLYITAGCFGQEGSSLYRLSENAHPKVKLERGDMVIFSQDPAPPYTKEAQDHMINNLVDLGADVHYYDLDEDIYVSGHGSQEDIVKLFEIANPKYFTPVGGTIRFMKSYADLAEDFGAPKENIFRLKPGESIIFENGRARRGPSAPVKKIYVDGIGVGDVGKIVLQDRQTLSQGGVVIAVVKLTKDKKLAGDPEIISRGFVFEKISKSMLIKAEKGISRQIKKKGKIDKRTVEETTQSYLTDFFFQKTARHPMILPVIVEV